MLTVNKLISQGRGLSRVLLDRAAIVSLDWDVRQKSRFDATDSQGRALGVFLPRGAVVRGGDVLVAEDGSLIARAGRSTAGDAWSRTVHNTDRAPSTCCAPPTTWATGMFRWN
jgi:hypothetical protein